MAYDELSAFSHQRFTVAACERRLKPRLGLKS